MVAIEIGDVWYGLMVRGLFLILSLVPQAGQGPVGSRLHLLCLQEALESLRAPPIAGSKAVREECGPGRWG